MLMMEPPAIADHLGDDVLTHQHLAAQVDRHGSVPNIEWEIGDLGIARQKLRIRKRRIVVKDVDTPETSDDCLDRRLHDLLLRKVR
jgi:hypothetical protein